MTVQLDLVLLEAKQRCGEHAVIVFDPELGWVVVVQDPASKPRAARPTGVTVTPYRVHLFDLLDDLRKLGPPLLLSGIADWNSRLKPR